MEEDVVILLEVVVHECSRGGVACCPNWSEAGHVLAELSDEMRWIHWVGGWSQYLAGDSYGLAVHEFSYRLM
jgi:hypothetical protein